MIAKFFFLGRWADVILLVLEHDVGGHVLVRRYALNRVSVMVRGLLDYYRKEGKCIEFKDDEKLKGLVSRILATERKRKER